MVITVIRSSPLIRMKKLAVTSFTPKINGEIRDLKILLYIRIENNKNTFSEQVAYVCLMMRQRSENVLEFAIGIYFLIIIPVVHGY